MTSQQLAQTLTSESEKIYNVLGVYPKYVRFDIDENENSNVLQVAQSLGFVVTSYNIDSMDYQSGANTQSIVAQYTNQFSSVMSGQGRFITVHQDLVPIYADQSILANVIKTASANGYKTVTLDVCVGDAAYRTKNDNSFSGKSSDATTTGISGILGLSALATLFNIFV